jgi:hypothetical protein
MKRTFTFFKTFTTSLSQNLIRSLNCKNTHDFGFDLGRVISIQPKLWVFWVEMSEILCFELYYSKESYEYSQLFCRLQSS